jgi:superfamily II DNA or RNA helicase
MNLHQKSIASESVGFSLRQYQKDSVDSVIRDFNSGHRKVAVILPTGAGKTEIMLATADKMIQQRGGKALILSHMGLLVGQTSDRAALRIPNRHIGWLKAGYTPRQTDDIIIGTMQSARIEHKINHINNINLIIIDEAHFITADSYKAILSRYPNAYVLGLTATPYKSKRLMTNQFEKVSYCASLNEMISQGYLLPPVMIGVQQMNDDVSIDVCKLYKERELGKSAICFMPSVEEAELMTSVFKMEGIHAATIVGDTPEATRRRAIDEFQAGNIKVLCTVDVLTAGFDAPCTEVILMPSRCGSPTVFMQRVGRGLRRYENKENCRVYFWSAGCPKIEKKFYEEIAKFAMEKKPDKMDIFEALEWAKYEDDEETMNYCMKMAKIHKDIKSMGHDFFADLIRQDALPGDLMGRIDLLHDKLSGVRARKTDTEATERQVDYLERILGTKVNSITLGEADSLISICGQMKQPSHPIYGEQWNVQSGIHKGKHVKDLPWNYVCFCLSKSPHGQISRLFHKWTEFKKELRA